jgi:hypothetical protein
MEGIIGGDTVFETDYVHIKFESGKVMTFACFSTLSHVTLPLMLKKKTFLFFLKGGRRSTDFLSSLSRILKERRGYRFRTVLTEAGVGRNNTWKHH